ncbi:MAG: pyridoxine 5'-phosphate synthase [Rhodospirillales bacterium]|nr:pyridoxine 5'-phosphate synthase [Rhodospirillales bacterium]
MARHLRLGVNIDHVATIRNARGGRHPDPVRAAKLAVAAGADGITAHLREDRRHISDEDIVQLRRILDAPLNLEMAATEDMLEIALRHLPHAVCLVPERREERTTEGGLDVAAGVEYLARYVTELSRAGIRVSLFIEPSLEQVNAAASIGAGVVEFHTGRYCHSEGEEREREVARIRKAAARANEFRIECHAGHGLNYDTVEAIAAIPLIVELNIGHFLIGEAIFRGLEAAISEMRDLMDDARATAPRAPRAPLL